ncbi:hypothetical protein CBM2589_U10189 [Cupriavidus taiwanensis]|uniref:Uncharacterized protein n=1 Tax=Cupriavidus taiwanensis TaxID=164546 RepID=A0A375CR04_9BURK|nr:hypothetical protein CBM2589_U10189 [Cupriavidus taiwanensis]
MLTSIEATRGLVSVSLLDAVGRFVASREEKDLTLAGHSNPIMKMQLIARKVPTTSNVSFQDGGDPAAGCSYFEAWSAMV